MALEQPLAVLPPAVLRIRWQPTMVQARLVGYHPPARTARLFPGVPSRHECCRAPRPSNLAPDPPRRRGRHSCSRRPRRSRLRANSNQPSDYSGSLTAEYVSHLYDHAETVIRTRKRIPESHSGRDPEATSRPPDGETGLWSRSGTADPRLRHPDRRGPDAVGHVGVRLRVLHARRGIALDVEPLRFGEELRQVVCDGNGNETTAPAGM